MHVTGGLPPRTHKAICTDPCLLQSAPKVKTCSLASFTNTGISPSPPVTNRPEGRWGASVPRDNGLFPLGRNTTVYRGPFPSGAVCQAPVPIHPAQGCQCKDEVMSVAVVTEAACWVVPGQTGASFVLLHHTRPYIPHNQCILSQLMVPRRISLSADHMNLTEILLELRVLLNHMKHLNDYIWNMIPYGTI